jgi:hypothetical protein
MLSLLSVAAATLTAMVLAITVTRASAACASDSVESGTVCVDKYEASVWYVPPVNTTLTNALIRRIRNGNVTLGNLTSPAAVAAGVVQVGLSAALDPNSDLALAGCPVTAEGCLNVYAVSIAGVRPATGLTWEQAAAAARNSQKRLPTNQEWQVAALGTPEGSTCPNTDDATVAPTGSHPLYVSDVGAFDMVGNVFEWVADWVSGRTGCGAALFGLEGQNCLALSGGNAPNSAVAIVRSGGGVFDVNGQRPPSVRENTLGFRAVR